MTTTRFTTAPGASGVAVRTRPSLPAPQKRSKLDHGKSSLLAEGPCDPPRNDGGAEDEPAGAGQYPDRHHARAGNSAAVLPLSLSPGRRAVAVGGSSEDER